MNCSAIFEKLEKNRNVFRELLKDVPEHEYRWKPKPEKWCLLEIVCHLHDEEREDFRARTKLILENPEEPMPSIDPQAWVQQRAYHEKDYERTLADFINEREESVAWLRSLNNAAWNNIYHHPKLGAMSARMMLANWLAHDYLHFRQITKVKYDYLQEDSKEPLGYAGGW